MKKHLKSKIYKTVYELSEFRFLEDFGKDGWEMLEKYNKDGQTVYRLAHKNSNQPFPKAYAKYADAIIASYKK
jgi:hypothetical protein